MISVCDNSENCVLDPVAHNENKRYFINNSDYKIDLWREFIKRWMVVGIFFVVILAVLGPKIGALGGPLHTQYLSYFPLAYISYASGRSCPHAAACRPPTRVLIVSCAHAHFVAPALCVVAVAALGDLTDLSIVKGSLYASVGAPCVWLSLSLSSSESGTTAQLVACNYIASLLAVPISTYVLCELATLPSYQSIAETCAVVIVPYCVGVTIPDCGSGGESRDTLVRLCALALLYVDCCGRLKNAEGLMYLGDVLVTLILEATCSVTSVATCWLYERYGLIPEGDAVAVALASIPKSGFGMVSRSTVCSWGVHSLPAAMATPLRAVLLADTVARNQRGET